MIIPTREQAWLLRACLLSGRDAVDAWKLWRRNVPFDDIDGASYRLMPLLHQNLRRENVEDELLGRIKGIYRHTWSRNQLLFHAAAGAMRELQAAQLPVLVLKGAALASSYYQDLGSRPMEDFDFMVHFENAPRAFELMTQAGWHYAESVSPQQVVWCSHAAKWHNGRGQQIDLHWNLLPEARQPQVENELWSRSASTMIGGQPFSAMDATDLLWHVCAHGGIGDATAPIRCVADAWVLLHRAPTIEWDRLVDVVQRRGLALPVGRALDYLHSELSAPIPPLVLKKLAAVRVTWTERWAHRIKSSPRGWSGALPLHCVNYLRQTRGQPLSKRVSTLPVFFQRTWGLPSAGRVPGYLFKKAWTRLYRRGA